MVVLMHMSMAHFVPAVEWYDAVAV